jgi:hypothetical protein
MNIYKYIIYNLYGYALRKKSDTPVLDVILILFLVHSFQLMSIYMILSKIFPQIYILNKLSKSQVAIGAIIFGLVNYFVLYDKKRWSEYIEKFKDLSPSEHKKRTIIVNSYFGGSIIIWFLLLFFVVGGGKL